MPQVYCEAAKEIKLGPTPLLTHSQPLHMCHFVSFYTGTSCKVSLEDKIPLINPLSEFMLPSSIIQGEKNLHL